MSISVGDIPLIGVVACGCRFKSQRGKLKRKNIFSERHSFFSFQTQIFGGLRGEHVWDWDLRKKLFCFLLLQYGSKKLKHQTSSPIGLQLKFKYHPHHLVPNLIQTEKISLRLIAKPFVTPKIDFFLIDKGLENSFGIFIQRFRCYPSEATEILSCGVHLHNFIIDIDGFERAIQLVSKITNIIVI